MRKYVQYFILECHLYDDNHKQLQKKFFSQLGINEMSIIPKDNTIKFIQKSEGQGDFMKVSVFFTGSDQN